MIATIRCGKSTAAILLASRFITDVEYRRRAIGRPTHLPAISSGLLLPETTKMKLRAAFEGSHSMPPARGVRDLPGRSTPSRAHPPTRDATERTGVKRA
jgi:hypothetical protein